MSQNTVYRQFADGPHLHAAALNVDSPLEDYFLLVHVEGGLPACEQVDGQKISGVRSPLPP